MRRARARFAILIALVLASASISVVTAAPAQAATSKCTAWTNSQIWQTSTRWGRARQRLCIEYTSTSVRGKVQLQIDWPIVCSISTGLPPVISSCTSPIWKIEGLDFHETKIYFGWQPYGTTTTYWVCNGGSWSTRQTDFTPTFTRGCYGPWASRSRYRSFRVVSREVSADVKDDGDGWKILDPVISYTFARP